MLDMGHSKEGGEMLKENEDWEEKTHGMYERK